MAADFVRYGVIGLAVVAVGAGVLYLDRHAPLRNPPVAPSQPAPAAAGTPDPAWHRTATYGAWEIQCPVNGKTNCAAVLRLIQQKTNTTVFGWMVGKAPDGALFSTLASPTGVVVGRGLELKVGNTPVRQLPYTTCSPQQCSASVPMDAKFVQDMKAADRATVRIFANTGQSLDFGMPVTGFGQALAALGQ